ncbi:lysophospholipase [Novosphingobium sp. PhB165]|uniref:alpha/beta hydrolase n=1 Tax=Novosphingobium sp. PhB165 TaxID=2485105 RepID=UPI001042A037|nr:alpha/beta hydrolase [Novosphingobium sp. PhB165]TCM19420.1 lysophospholipase [Novosphingobium sp. PhB165]
MDGPARARRAIPAGVVEGRWLAADGKTAIRRIDWPPPDSPRGSLLFLPGRGDAYEKWLETLEQWHSEGWAVSSIDWRGQALSGRLGRDGMTGHVDDFATWIDDLALFWADWARERPGPHVLVGHSMGGHLAMRAVTERRVVPDALVLSAPMLGLHPTTIPTAILHPVARAIQALGDSRRPAWKGNEKPELIPQARMLLLTHDESRYADEDWWRRQRPAIAMGAASWHWVERAIASIRGLETKGILESVDVPVLLLGVRHDGLVSWPAIRRAAARLPHATLISWGRRCRHEILREVDPVRDEALAAIRDFLNEAAPVRG